MMDESAFWKLIDTSRVRAAKVKRDPTRDFIDVHMEELQTLLEAVPAGDVAEFAARFHERSANAYRWDLWAVAYWMGGGCSDDGFIDFRSCLISLGRARYEAAIKDPDSLAAIVGEPNTPYMQAEGFQYVAQKVYENNTGQQIPHEIYTARQAKEPAGEQFDFDNEDEMAERFPKLIAKMPEMGD